MSKLAERLWIAVAVALAFTASACHRSPRGNAQETALSDAVALLPTITSVEPDSVVLAQGVVVEVTVHGRGFAPGKPGMNTIQFGSVTLTHVPSNESGTEIRLVIPDIVASGEAPPIPIQPGSYMLRVATPRGTSNPMTIRVFR